MAPRKIVVRDRKGKFRSLLIGLREESILYTGRSKNRKNDDMPQQWVGNSRPEALATCTVCPMYHDKTCYAQFGSTVMGFSNIVSANKRGRNYSFTSALEQKSKTAKFIRMGANGDSGSIAPDIYLEHDKKARNQGLGVLSYTHHWFLDHAKFLRGVAMASCDTWTDVIDAVKDGWRTAFHIDKDDKAFNGFSILEKPQGTVDGIRYTLCPAQRKDFLGWSKEIFCNDCGLCDATVQAVGCIVFAEHGVQMKHKKQRENRRITSG